LGALNTSTSTTPREASRSSKPCARKCGSPSAPSIDDDDDDDDDKNVEDEEAGAAIGVV